MHKLLLMWKLLLSLPKTIYFNLHYFPLKQALKLPVLVGYNVHLRERKGKVILPDKISPFLIKIGFQSGSFHLSAGKYSVWQLEGQGEIRFAGPCLICRGCCLVVHDKTVVRFGANFQANANFLLVAGAGVTFGDDCLVGWNNTVIDGDGHRILVDGKSINPDRAISVGDHCWLAAEVSLLKGTVLQNETVVGYGTTVSGTYDEAHCIVAGSKAACIKTGIQWKD